MNHVCNIHIVTRSFTYLYQQLRSHWHCRTLLGRIGFFGKSVMVDEDMGCGDQAFTCQ